MSVRVMTWVWENSPTGGNERLVLLAIADAADDQGRNAWPSVATLARKTNLAERTVRRVIARLAADGHIEVAHGGGRWSSSYRVPMEPRSGCQGGHADPGPGDPGQVDPTPRSNCPGTPVTADRAPRTPVTGHPGQPCPGTRPVPVLEPPSTPPEDTCQEPGTAPEPDGGGGGQAAQTFFAVLGSDWRLSGRQRRRLAPRVDAALAAGWRPAALAAHVGANTAGVRNPYAVLGSRLADLPDPPRQAAPRPPWCGACDERTRLLEDVRGSPFRCPACHPQRVPGGEAA